MTDLTYSIQVLEAAFATQDFNPEVDWYMV